MSHYPPMPRQAPTTLGRDPDQEREENHRGASRHLHSLAFLSLLEETQGPVILA